MSIIRLGVDIAKQVFVVHGIDDQEQVVWKACLKRDVWISALIKRVAPGAVIGLEACASAHHWGRVLSSHGYHVKLIGHSL